MFELFIALSKKLFGVNDSKGSLFFRHFLLGPIFIIATLLIALFKQHIFPVWGGLWALGFGSSLFFGFVIWILAFKEITLLFVEIKQKRDEKEEQIKLFQEEVKAAHTAAQSEKEAMLDQVKVTQDRVQEMQSKAAAFEELIAQKKYDGERLEEEKETLFQEKVLAQQQAMSLLEKQEELKPLQDNLLLLENENLQLSQQIKAQNDEKERLEQTLQQFKEAPPPHPYEELRKQFEEKAHVLNETRKELFELQSECGVLKKQSEEKSLEPHEEIEPAISQLIDISTYSEHLEDEVDQLHDLVTHLSVKKPSPKGRKTTKKVKVDESVVIDLISKKAKATKSKVKSKAKTKAKAK